MVAGLAPVTCTMRLLNLGPGILRWAQGFLATDWGEILDALALGDTNRLDHHDPFYNIYFCNKMCRS